MLCTRQLGNNRRRLSASIAYSHSTMRHREPPADAADTRLTPKRHYIPGPCATGRSLLRIGSTSLASCHPRILFLIWLPDLVTDMTLHPPDSRHKTGKAMRYLASRLSHVQHPEIARGFPQLLQVPDGEFSPSRCSPAVGRTRLDAPQHPICPTLKWLAGVCVVQGSFCGAGCQT